MTRNIWLFALSILAASANAQPLLDAKTSLARVLSPKPGAARSCPRCDLRGADLSGKDLTEINLTGADLSNANLTNARLDSASFNGANLTGTRFDQASVKRSNFSRANLTGASFAHASLAGANLQFAALTGTNFSDADRTGVIFGPRGGGAAGRKSAPLVLATSSGIVCGSSDLSALTSRVFVTNSGTDNASCGASMDAACGSIAFAMQHCAPSNCGVLVAWDQYHLSEPIKLRDGVNVYGGCVDANTLQAKDLYSSITAPPDGAPVLRAENINQGALVQNFELIGSDGTDGTGHASIAVAIARSQALRFQDVSIVAGRGGNGAWGVDGPAGKAGDNANGTSGGLSGTKQSGGHGGESNAPRDCANNPDQCWGQPGSTQSGPSDRAGGGGQPDRMGVYYGPDGQQGPHGVCPEDFGLPLPAGGTFCCATLEWRPVAAFNGFPGQEGGGGGGGAIGMTIGNSGGGGGGGGLGGAGGKGGQSGGASVAMILVKSKVKMTHCFVYGGLSGSGGRGGSGGPGGGGGQGAPPLTADPNGAIGGHGGNGGGGGAGSGGGGGNAGPSIMLGLASSTVDETDVHFFAGTSGNAGDGGPGGQGDCSGPDGIGGFSGAVGKSIALSCNSASTGCDLVPAGIDVPIPIPQVKLPRK
ncbi:MAG: hypothetical protein QOK37_1512 [Thermoanaerobaculia bacterium]|nr:hypothetical protein [Thermoanaerobaculia bacterium]